MSSSFSRPGVTVNTSLTPLASSPGAGTSGAVAAFAAPLNIGPTVPTEVTSWQQYVSLFGGFSQISPSSSSALHYAVYQYFTNGGTGCFVFRVPNTDAVAASATIDSITDVTVSTLNPILTLTVTNPGAWGNQLFYEIVPVSGSTQDNTVTFTLNIYRGGTSPVNLVEAWPSVSMNPSSPRYLLSLINSTGSGGSKFVFASIPVGAPAYSAGSGESDPVGNAGSPTAFANGADGSTSQTDQAFSTAVTTALSSLPGDLVLNVNSPGADVGVNNSLISWAQAQGNVFVICDGEFIGNTQPSATVAEAYVALTTGTGGTVLTGAACAALYGPWLSIPDPASASPTATKWVAPGGAILGVYAQNDAQNNVAQAPAGITATVNCVTLEAFFTPTDLNNLQAAMVNPVKLIPNSGFCVFGAQTLEAGYPNQFVNVSRTLIQFITDFQSITQFAIFQNNDPTLWASVANVLTNYLNNAMAENMLASSTASTAFSVVCDDTINTSTSAQAGIVNAQVAVALVSPAEFIVINLSQMSSGTSTAAVSS
jgi:uncharacterized protein